VETDRTAEHSSGWGGGLESQSGDLVGMYTLKRPQVSRATAAKRMEHRMIDRNSIKKQLRRAGLYVMEEQVWGMLNVQLIDRILRFGD
jgi:hypothetical protein